MRKFLQTHRLTKPKISTNTTATASTTRNDLFIAKRRSASNYQRMKSEGRRAKRTSDIFNSYVTQGR